MEKTQAATSATLTRMKSMAVMSSDTPNTSRKLKWIWSGMLQSSLVIASINSSYAINNNDIEKEKYKLYSHIKLTNSRQYLCLEKLWTRESQWNPTAKNKYSTAYGIPQLLKLKIKDPYLQIDAGLKYISHRYNKPCKALAFHLKHGYY